MDTVRKRILVLTTSYPLRDNGVSGIFVKNLVDSLGKYCEILVVTPSWKHSEVKNLDSIIAFRYAPRTMEVLAHEAGGMPVKLKKNPFMFLFIPSFIFSFIWTTLLAHVRAEIVFANWSLSGVVGVIPKRLFGKPLVTCLRGEDVKVESSKIKKHLLRVVLSESDRVVVVGDYMKDALNKHFPQYSNKIVVIKNGVKNLNRHRKHAIQETLKNPRFAFVGSFIQRKNISFLIHEFNGVFKKHPCAELRVIGDGPLLLKVEAELKRLDCRNNVYLLGALNNDAVLDVLFRSDFYISASLHEGRSNAVVESMVSGCIPILSDIDSHNDILVCRCNSLLFDLDSPGNLCEIVCGLLRHPDELKRVQDEVEAYVEREFYDWAECAKRYLKVFSSVSAQD